MAQEYDRVDQWVNWGDHTVTIDPIGNKPWIHEGQDGKHLEAAERGRAYDAADVQHLMVLRTGPSSTRNCVSLQCCCCTRHTSQVVPAHSTRAETTGKSVSKAIWTDLVAYIRQAHGHGMLRSSQVSMHSYKLLPLEHVVLRV